MVEMIRAHNGREYVIIPETEVCIGCRNRPRQTGKLQCKLCEEKSGREQAEATSAIVREVEEREYREEGIVDDSNWMV